ncbi:uncharacterized protein FIBRA_00349 [Fibroporia radiculosa]|uniref:F-box domain-containing protein n=1 Tax=Fibroporia radiculosa TaxID=599839 RepID=J7S609_9APHY|nr:uncharacterized protein FIBRA_00349 [Fibroporia radiculosa]CCL98354.1 predicted protein [Fibroporia radiculosa]
MMRTAQAHRALECDDVLEEIFSYLRFDNALYSDITLSDADLIKWTLASAAFVNKTLSYHALNNLWREIPSESVALNVLPSFQAIFILSCNNPHQKQTYVRIPCSLNAASSYDQQVINGEIHARDLDRFRQYAIRVRSINSIDEEVKLDDRLPIIQHIAARLGGPFFPNLMRLRWDAQGIHAVTANTGRVLLCMAGSKLRTLTLRSPLSLSETQDSLFYPQLSKIVPEFAAGSARIQEIYLDGMEWDENVKRT